MSGRLCLLVLGCGLALALSACGITDPATSIGDTSATLNGRVHPRGGSNTWWFQYGETTAYGSETSHEDAGTGTQLVPVSATVTGLKPATTYHYRLCTVQSGEPTSCGQDASFDTTSPLPRGFSESTVFSGLDHPTAVRFSPDGRVFVAEKSGLIKVYDSLTDSAPKVFADLRTNVDNFWDRGLLGIALDPGFPTKPYVYVLYTYDAAIGGTAPRWGTAGATTDSCPDPPGTLTGGCMVSGRLSRLQASGDSMTGTEKVLINDWCQQFAHAGADLAFGADGALYASGGDGASPLDGVDYGQLGGNPCGDPAQEGGALRSQSLGRPPGEPVVLAGTLVRVDPATGAGLADNPLAGSSDANARRIVAYGLRNPFRFAIRPGTSEVWIADAGWKDWEEIDRVANPTAAVLNFGWPCYEGAGPQPVYQAAGLSLCQNLYAHPGAVTAPFYSYAHTDKVVAGEGCPSGGSAISGVDFQFYAGGPYPAEYDGALFFADHQRDCIWAMERNGSTLPDKTKIKTFVRGAANPVDLQIGPGGDLYYVDHEGGTIRRIRYSG